MKTKLGLMLPPRKCLFSSRQGETRKDQDVDRRPLFGLAYKTYIFFSLNFIAACIAREAVKLVMTVYWCVHRNFQQNIALFCAISDF